MRLSIWLGLFCLSQGHAVAQDAPAPADAAPKTVHVVRTATPPTIDGDLGDAVWQSAAVVDDLHQVEPIEFRQAVHSR